MNSATSLCPIIINSSLSRSGFLDYLGNGFKTRMSGSTPKDSVILPSSGIAALVIEVAKLAIGNDTDDVSVVSSFTKDSMPDAPPSGTKRTDSDAAASKAKGIRPHQRGKLKEENKMEATGDNGEWELESLDKLVSRVEAFQRCHRIGLILLVGSVFAAEEAGSRVMCSLQKRLMPSPPLILPAHGDAQVAAHIQMLSKVCQSENREVVQARVTEIKSSVLKKEQNVIIGRAMGLNYHQASVLMDSFGSIENVAKASAADIHQRTPLDAAAAATVAAFLAKDTVSL